MKIVDHRGEGATLIRAGELHPWDWFENMGKALQALPLALQIEDGRVMAWFPENPTGKYSVDEDCEVMPLIVSYHIDGEGVE